MSKIAFSNGVFTCHINCDQCSYIKSDGNRCRNRVCFGHPVCWVHTRRMYGVRVKASTVEHGGRGLFTERNVERLQWICPYIGELIDDDCLDARYPGDRTAPYAVLTNDDEYTDSACARGVGAMANGLFGADGHSLAYRRHNAIIDERVGYGLWVRALRNIPPGGEIFVYYGREYTLDNDHSTKRRRVADNRPC